MVATSHQKRFATALVLLALLATAVAFGGWVMRLLIIAVSSLALYEFFSLYWPDGLHKGRKILGLSLGAALLLSQAVGAYWTLAVLAFCFWIPALGFLFAFGKGRPQARLEDSAPLLYGLVYIPLALQLALYLSGAEQMLVVLAAVTADTGGYYAGTYFGKRKLWPSVSPKKSWAGVCGGMLLCIVCYSLFGLSGNLLAWPLPVLPVWAWPLTGFALFLAALFGDLFESALKRTLHVKDSGASLPGHGGWLDRIDSLLFVLPVYMGIRMTLSL